ncbi:hypothetical protein ACFQO7_22605 [Catellatospora aurea]|uniref:Uncharacterized protein n=1 Tax=Catellatospora aurea TaxID=1337874 RepID=A0ABW2H1Z5_9ACTN
MTRVLRRSLVAVTVAMVATGVHHVFRLGTAVLPAAIGLSLVPLVLVALYRWRTSWWLLAAYLLYNVLVVWWFGVVDGFLDHVLKAAGLSNLTFLPGSDQDVVPTVYRLWSPQATSVFYEGTGVLTAAASAFAAYYAWRLTSQLLRQRRANHQQTLG